MCVAQIFGHFTDLFLSRTHVMIQIDETTAYDVQEMSEKLNLSPDTIRTYCKIGKLKGAKGGAEMVCDPISLLKYLMNRIQKIRISRY